MHQIKIFKGLETDISFLEKQVNSWLFETQVRVVHMFGNLSPQTAPVDTDATAITKGPFPSSDVFLVVVYEKN
jgi:hypothetical protein